MSKTRSKRWKRWPADGGHPERDAEFITVPGGLAAMTIPTRNGFAPISRELLDVLPKIQGNAVKLFLFLHLRCRFQNPDRGTLAASYETIAYELAWSKWQVRRAVDELREKGLVAVESE